MNKLLLKRLSNYVEHSTLLGLTNIRNSKMKSILQCDNETCLEFISFLYNEKLIEIKINVYCDCEEIYTIYSSKFGQDIICSECGAVIPQDRIKNSGEWLYTIDKEEFLSYMHDNITKIDHKAEIFNERKDKKRMNKKPKVFIGSSQEAIDTGVVLNVATILERLKCTIIKWNDPGIFVGGDYTYDSLVSQANNVDAAIFIFKADDKIWFRENEIAGVRSNVLLEYGMFSGKMTRKNVIFITSGSPDIISDLKGINYYDYDRGLNTLESELKVWVDRIFDKID